MTFHIERVTFHIECFTLKLVSNNSLNAWNIKILYIERMSSSKSSKSSVYSTFTRYPSDDVIGVRNNGCIIHTSIRDENEPQDKFGVGKIFFDKDTAKLEVKNWKQFVEPIDGIGRFTNPIIAVGEFKGSVVLDKVGQFGCTFYNGYLSPHINKHIEPDKYYTQVRYKHIGRSLQSMDLRPHELYNPVTLKGILNLIDGLILFEMHGIVHGHLEDDNMLKVDLNERTEQNEIEYTYMYSDFIQFQSYENAIVNTVLPISHGYHDNDSRPVEKLIFDIIYQNKGGVQLSKAKNPDFTETIMRNAGLKKYLDNNIQRVEKIYTNLNNPDPYDFLEYEDEIEYKQTERFIRQLASVITKKNISTPKQLKDYFVKYLMHKYEVWNLSNLISTFIYSFRTNEQFIDELRTIGLKARNFNAYERCTPNELRNMFVTFMRKVIPGIVIPNKPTHKPVNKPVKPVNKPVKPVNNCMDKFSLNELKMNVDKLKLDKKFKRLNKPELCDVIHTYLDNRDGGVDIKPGRKIKAVKCPQNKIINPKTGNCVSKTGAIGKKLVRFA